METESLRKKLDMLWLKVQEIKTREAMIDSKTSTLLAKSVSLDKELIVQSNLKGGKHRAYEQGETNSGPDSAHLEVTEEEDGEEIVYKPPFLGRLKGGD